MASGQVHGECLVCSKLNPPWIVQSACSLQPGNSYYLIFQTSETTTTPFCADTTHPAVPRGSAFNIQHATGGVPTPPVYAFLPTPYLSFVACWKLPASYNWTINDPRTWAGVNITTPTCMSTVAISDFTFAMYMNN